MVEDHTDGPTPDDPYAGLVFDEDWAAAATHHEEAADRRLAAVPAPSPRSRRPRRVRNVVRRVASAVLRPSTVRTFMVLAFVLVGLSWANLGGGAGGSLVLGGSSSDRPTPSAADSDTPLGIAPEPPARPGRYAFMTLQDDGATPVTYDPCRPIHIVVNDADAPWVAAQLLDDALTGITEATGLQFVVEGRTSEEPRIDRPEYQRGRYGDRWAPVLVAWTDPETVPDLAGEVAGLAGSTAVQVDGSTWVYVSGIVYLDAPDFVQILDEPHGWEQARAIVLHELGHLVGLAHVEDQRELMDHRGHRFTVDFGAGDLAGLARLGRGPCIAFL